ncbi:hypothetical protein [Acetomicrobium sp.]
MENGEILGAEEIRTGTIHHQNNATDKRDLDLILFNQNQIMVDQFLEI